MEGGIFVWVKLIIAYYLMFNAELQLHLTSLRLLEISPRSEIPLLPNHHFNTLCSLIISLLKFTSLFRACCNRKITISERILINSKRIFIFSKRIFIFSERIFIFPKWIFIFSNWIFVFSDWIFVIVN